MPFGESLRQVSIEYSHKHSHNWDNNRVRHLEMCLLSFDVWIASTRLHGSYEALKYGTTLDGLADLTGGVTESLSVVGGGHINKDSSFHVRLLARLLANTSILTAVAHRPAAGTLQQQPNSLTSPPQPNNKENNNNNNSLSSCNSGSTTTSNGLTTPKEQSQHQQSSRSVTDRLPVGILVGINYKICAVDKVRRMFHPKGHFIQILIPFFFLVFSTSLGGYADGGERATFTSAMPVRAARREHGRLVPWRRQKLGGVRLRVGGRARATRARPTARRRVLSEFSRFYRDVYGHRVRPPGRRNQSRRAHLTGTR